MTTVRPGYRLNQLNESDSVFPLRAYPLKFSAFISFLVGVLVFLNSVNGTFVFDDSEAVLNNQDVQPEAPISNILFNDFWGTPLTHNRSHKSYRPITVLTFRWNVWIAGGVYPFGFHLTNILLHGIVSALVVPVANKLYGGNAPRMSLLTSLLFAVHPIHTEAVAGVVGRADLLCTLFSFLSLLSYVKAVETPLASNSLRSSSYLLASLLLCFLALFSKEQGITVLGICFLYDLIVFQKVNIFNCPFLIYETIVSWYPERLGQKVYPTCTVSEVSKGFCGMQNENESLLKRAPIFRTSGLLLTGILLLCTRWRVMGSKPPIFQPVDNPASFEESIWIRMWNYNYLYSLNVWLLLCPEWLCFDWSMGCVPILSNLFDPRLSVVITMWGSTICLLRRGIISASNNTGRTLNMAMAVAVIPFLPATNLFFRVGFVLAERVLYLPSLGFCMLIVLGLSVLMKHKPKYGQIIMSLFSCLLLLFFVRSSIRSGEWLDEKSLFRSALAICPLNAKVHYNVAKNAGDMGDKELALREYTIALKLHPQYDQAMNNMANILREEGKLSEAESLLREALKIRSDFAAAWMNLGIVLAGMKRHKEAEVSYATALTHRSHYPECLYNLGNLYLDLKMHNEAYKTFQKAVKLRPPFSIAWNNMVILLETTGNLIEARKVAQEALSILPSDPGLHFNLANTLGKMNLFSDAEKHFQEAVKLAPTNALYHSNMGVLYHRWKKYTLAEAKYRDALRLDPHLKSAENNLAMLKTSHKKVSSTF